MARTEFEEDQEMLKRIAAKLLSMAALAERVSVLPVAIRFLVLWLLRPAEAIAREFVAEETGGPLALPEPALFGEDRGSRADALRLAYCFRALAAVIYGLLADDGHDAYRHRPLPGEPVARFAHLFRRIPLWSRTMSAPGAMLSACAVGLIDTS